MGAVQISFAASIVALLAMWNLARYVLSKDQGTEKMREISLAIQRGASAFLRREYRAIGIVVIVVAVLLSLGPFLGLGDQVDYRTALAFVWGAIASAIAGYVAMWVGTRSNARTAAAAMEGLKSALNVSFSAGATTGLSIVGVALFGLSIVYWLSNGNPFVINGYAMGASLVALFARAGGGIYTKGADMGADLVGKVEAGIPEDDPRNAAVIADNVGDNVGDTAGLGADLLESYVESIIAAIAIGSTTTLLSGQFQLSYIPLLIASWGVFSSVVGIAVVRFLPAKDPQRALNSGVYTSAIIMALGSAVIIRLLSPVYQEGGIVYGGLGVFWAILSGLLSGLIIGGVSEYYSSSRFKPVRNLAESAQSGPAVVVVGGLAIGMESTLMPVVVIGVSTLIGYYFAGMFGVAMAALGMLSILGMTLSVDSYGPVADNASGIATMAGLKPEVREITDKLDAVGNTTAAIGKGFAIGSAAFAALGLFTAYISTITRVSGKEIVFSITNPRLVVGLLVGGMIPFFFSALLARGVGKTAYRIVEEVRRQFREIKGLMEGEGVADATVCVDIATQGALRSMMLPGILAIIIPVVIGFTLGPVSLAGFLVGALVTGLQLGIQMANSGAAMDNAKKYIEEGHFGGKGSPAHKAAVVGDTVGDPLKDTLGPSINILIKLMTVISLVLAPLFVIVK